MTLTSTMTNHTRRWARVLLVVAAVAAGAVCTAAGIGSATTDVDTGPVEWINWRVHNATGQTLTSGTVTQVEHTKSSVDVTGLKPGEYRTGFYEAGSWYEPNYSSVDNVCYNHTQWSFWDHFFGADTFGTSSRKWRDVYIFFRGGTLSVTPEGAFDDRDLNPSRSC
ncbi:hypothetical protein [Rhodococcus jostii]|uniref:hypothetical protein n=1 Tax=Rhodococcus jostii TaxID=132919 RepID=UPI0036618649